MSLKYLINSVAGFAALLIATFCTATEGNATLVFVANLNGPSESPPNASLGTGVAEVDFDTVADTMRVSVAFQGLLGTTTASHIHCCTTVPLTGTAGVATQVPTFPSFPLGVTSGTYDQTFNMLLDSSYNPAFEAANGGTAASAEAALLAAMLLGETYLNIHTTFAPSGEIRGFLTQAPGGEIRGLTQVPEPASLVLFGTALAGLGVMRRRRGSRRRVL